MKYLVHDGAGFQVEVAVSHHPICGPTVEIFSTWPLANHPEPHRLLSLTLPAESLRRLASAIGAAADQGHGIADQGNDRPGIQCQLQRNS